MAASVSSEYAGLRDRLHDWFEMPANPEAGIVLAVRTSADSKEGIAMWETRAGFVGDGSLSCSGLAVIVRRGLIQREGIYRVDVYEPQGQRLLPGATQMAGRIEYAPAKAGFTYSTSPDAAPTSEVYDQQFKIMHHLLDFINRDPASAEQVRAWVDSYEEVNVVPTPLDGPFLTLLEGRLQPPDFLDQWAA